MEYAEVIKLIANYGIGIAFAVVFIGLHVHIVRVMIPMMIQQFREELAIERKQCQDNHVEIAARIGKLEEAVTRLAERTSPRRG